MALYSDVIADIRKENRDLKRRERDLFDGDGVSSVFILTKDCVVAGSYELRVSNALKTEGVDYTLDRDSGEIVMTAAPAAGNDNVAFTYQYVRATDEQYVDWLNDGLDHFRKKLWVEVIDDSTLTSTADANEIDLSSISSNVEAMVDVWFKDMANADTSLPWATLSSVTNVSYLRGLNKLQISPPLPVTGWPIKVHLLRGFTKGSAVGDTFPVPDRFINVFKLYAKAEYLMAEAYKRLHDTTAVTKEETFVPSDRLFAQASKIMQEAESECSRVRQPRPATKIPILIR